MPNGLANCYDDLRFRDEVLAAGRLDFGLGRAVHGPRAPKASSSLMTGRMRLSCAGDAPRDCYFPRCLSKNRAISVNASLVSGAPTSR